MSGFDFRINGVDYRIVRSVEGTRGYRKRWVRQSVASQVTAPEQGLQSASDEGVFYQSSWSGGSRWEKPLLRPNSRDTFFTSRNFDLFTKPGFAVPANFATFTNDTNFNVIGTGAVKGEDIFMIGTTELDTAGKRDVYKWNRATNAWVRDIGYHSGVGGSLIHGMTYDAALDRVFVYEANNIVAIDVTTPADGVVVATPSGGSGAGRNVFLHNGRLFAYTGAILMEILDPLGTPSLTTIANDGMGEDFLDLINNAATTEILDRRLVDLAIPTTEGVFYVKNVVVGNQPQPWVFRIDRDSGGTDISTPVATLPKGVAVLDMGWHLGSLVMIATEEGHAVVENDVSTTGHYRTALYHLTGGNLGMLGVPLGDTATLDESVNQILGSEGPYLFLGGTKRVWIYDAIRGGIFPWLFDTAPTNNSYFTLFRNRDSSDDEILLLVTQERYATIKDRKYANPDTVTNFGDDLTHYQLESNYFDFDLPHEDKTLTEVRIETDDLDANQQFTVQIEVDDGAFTTIATHSNSKFSVTDLSDDVPQHTGKRFRYKVIYETKNANNKALRSIIFKAETGEMVPVWSLILDGSEFRNVENAPVDPNDVYDNLETLAQTKAPVAAIDSYRQFEIDDTSTHQVKVASLEIFKGDPGESEIHVTLVGAGPENG